MSLFKRLSNIFSSNDSEIFSKPDTFIGCEVKEYNVGDNLSLFNGLALRLSVSYDEYETGKTIMDKLEYLILQPEVCDIESLIFGPWGEEFDVGPQKLLDFLVQNKTKFSHLNAIYVGHIEQEECEMSWIIQASYESFLNAFTDLEHLKIRGSQDLDVGKINHPNLKSFVIESGGLPSKVINSVIEANLPALECLALWLGDDGYGFDGTIATLKPLMMNKYFPNLEYLGLKNSQIADEIAQLLPGSPLLAQIKSLDLSMGTLGDLGAQAILDNDEFNHLELLDLHFHYMSDEMMNKLKELPFEVNVDDQQEADMDDGEEWRYVAVSE